MTTIATAARATTIAAAPPIRNTNPLLDAGLLGEYLGVSRPTARKMLLEGEIPGVVFIRTRPLIRLSDVEAFLAGGGSKRRAS